MKGVPYGIPSNQVTMWYAGIPAYHTVTYIE